MNLTALAETTFLKISAIVFAAGMVLRILFVLVRRGSGPHAPGRKSPVVGAFKSLFKWFIPKRGFLRRNPIGAVAALVLHVCLFFIIFFDPYHSIFLWDELLGFSWEPFDIDISTIFTIIGIGALGVLLLNRLIFKKMRAVSTPGDFIALCMI